MRCYSFENRFFTTPPCMSSLIFYFELFKKPIYLLLNYNKHNLRAINCIDPGSQPIYLFIYARVSYWSNNDVCVCVGVLLFHVNTS